MNNLNVKNKYATYLYGTIIILSGVVLLFSENKTFNFIKITLASLLIIGAILAFLSAFSRQKRQVQFTYHEMHAMAMLVYGVSVLLFCNKLETLVFYTAFLFIYYTFSEIIFCNWLLI